MTRPTVGFGPTGSSARSAAPGDARPERGELGGLGRLDPSPEHGIRWDRREVETIQKGANVEASAADDDVGGNPFQLLSFTNTGSTSVSFPVNSSP